MTEAVGGLAAANERMNRIEHSIEMLTAEIPKVVNLIQRVSEKVDARFDESMVRADKKAEALLTAARPDLAKYSGAVSIVVTIFLFGIGGFATYVKGNLETDISRLEHAGEKTDAMIGKLADKVQVDFIPRKELDLRFSKDEDTLADKVDSDALDQIKIRYEDQLSALRADVERIKNDVVSRREVESHWATASAALAELTSRLNVAPAK